MINPSISTILLEIQNIVTPHNTFLPLVVTERHMYFLHIHFLKVNQV